MNKNTVKTFDSLLGYDLLPPLAGMASNSLQMFETSHFELCLRLERDLVMFK